LRAGASKLQSEFSPRPEKNRSEAYCVGAAVVVFAAFVFFVFVAFVFFAFVAFVVSWVVSCANTGMASEKTIIPVNNSVRSFFMLGLDLLRDYFLLCLSNAWAIFEYPTRYCQIIEIPRVTRNAQKPGKDGAKYPQIAIHQDVWLAHQME